MDYESRIGALVKGSLAAVGLGGVAAVVMLPRPFGIWVGVAIVVLFVLFFGGYYLWRRVRAKRQREKFSSAIEAQTAAAPKSISDPNKRAALDKLRQKFQTGLQEFKSRGKDIYKLPWYVIIGEPGSGKSEAIRHSGVEFPPGLQDELQGSGGTVNMDWWFTNRGIILDTAGSMIFNEAQAAEAPEWREFLRLLKRARPQCPINGLFLVLSIESLIKDSADKISEKASRLAQQLDLIQRTLDVRFPVYLLVTKADLLTGFREFFDNIEDPLLQHQMFGWSNPEPLDSHFRPDMVEQHLKSVADRLRRRRMALLRETAGTGRLGGDTVQFFKNPQPLGQGAGITRRLDEVDALFALPESVMRLVPRLRRYLETVFVAGEWSAKPVFLRGIYFTSSMREGKALDEAIALATGLSVDQLPEDRSWEKNRSFFLRDLFTEKVFRESGLVTRATNTLQMLRKRQIAIFGTAGVALLLLLVFSGFSYRSLKRSVLAESSYWQAGAKGWEQGSWSPAIVRAGTDDVFKFSYTGTNLVEVTGGDLTLVEYHRRLSELAGQPLTVGLIFKPVYWAGLRGAKDRPLAQRILFEHGVLKPLVVQTRNKIQRKELDAANPQAVERHREALLSLIRLEADRVAADRGNIADTNTAAKYLESFVAYLTEAEPGRAGTDLGGVFSQTYSDKGGGAGEWPPPFLLGGERLADNPAIGKGLESLKKANQSNENRILEELELANTLTEALTNYQRLELQWLAKPDDSCGRLTRELAPAKKTVEDRTRALQAATNHVAGSVTNLTGVYQSMEKTARSASEQFFQDISGRLPDTTKTSGLFADIGQQVKQFASEAARVVRSNYMARSSGLTDLDTNYLLPSPGGGPSAYELRWALYRGACDLASENVDADDLMLGDEWKRFARLKQTADQFRAGLVQYSGAYADSASNACQRIAGQSERQLRERFVDNYVAYATNKVFTLATGVRSLRDVTNANFWYGKVSADLAAGPEKLADQAGKLGVVRSSLEAARKQVVQRYTEAYTSQIQTRLKFPVVLSPGAALDAPGLLQLRQTLNTLEQELTDPVWQSFPAGEQAIRQLAQNPYKNIVNALVDSTDKLTEMEVFFVPPAPAQEQDRNIINVYRMVQVSIGGTESGWVDVTRPRAGPLGKGLVDRGVKISFRRLESDAASEVKALDQAEWGLLQMIRDGQASRQENGAHWRISIPLEAPQQTMRGNAVFEVRLARPLPKVEEWPKP
jgi:hypothetical protein